MLFMMYGPNGLPWIGYILLRPRADTAKAQVGLCLCKCQPTDTNIRGDRESIFTPFCSAGCELVSVDCRSRERGRITPFVPWFNGKTFSVTSHQRFTMSRRTTAPECAAGETRYELPVGWMFGAGRQRLGYQLPSLLVRLQWKLTTPWLPAPHVNR